jgi:hypothetical protein
MSVSMFCARLLCDCASDSVELTMLCHGVRNILQPVSESKQHRREKLRAQYQKMHLADVYLQAFSTLARRRPLLAVAPSPSVSEIIS